MENVNRFDAPCTGTDSATPATVTHLAGMTIRKLRDRYRSELYDEYLPYCDRYVVDYDYGGFMCNAAPDGRRVNTEKRAWYEGRGIWIYAFLYNKMGGDRSNLKIAHRAGGVHPPAEAGRGRLLARLVHPRWENAHRGGDLRRPLHLSRLAGARQGARHGALPRRS